MTQEDEIQKVKWLLQDLVKHSKLSQADIEFTANGKQYKYSVVHNLGSDGMLQAALDNWLVRINDYSVYSFIRYIDSKRIAGMTDHIMFPQEDFESMIGLESGEVRTWISK